MCYRHVAMPASIFEHVHQYNKLKKYTWYGNMPTFIPFSDAILFQY